MMEERRCYGGAPKERNQRRIRVFQERIGSMRPVKWQFDEDWQSALGIDRVIDELCAGLDPDTYLVAVDYSDGSGHLRYKDVGLPGAAEESR